MKKNGRYILQPENGVRLCYEPDYTCTHIVKELLRQTKVIYIVGL